MVVDFTERHPILLTATLSDPIVLSFFNHKKHILSKQFFHALLGCRNLLHSLFSSLESLEGTTGFDLYSTFCKYWYLIIMSR